MEKQPSLRFCLRILLVLLLLSSETCRADAEEYVSALGDPGMKSKLVRVALEAWNFCNEVGTEAPGMGSPRYADCTDFDDKCRLNSNFAANQSRDCIHRKVTGSQNLLGVGRSMGGIGLSNFNLSNPDEYAVAKEKYLGELCEVKGANGPWQFWNVMLKNGNFDTESGLCPQNGKNVKPFKNDGKFPCFGKGCMNQPLVVHRPSSLQNGSLTGSFYGTYDLSSDPKKGVQNASYFSVTWKKGPNGSWLFHHVLRTSKNYPWLMLYLRADATRGFSGGYPHDTRGMMNILPESPNFKARLSLNITKGGGFNSQFYLMDIGSCWKNDGTPCDGNPTSDVTRYSEMIINPDTKNWCKPKSLENCPPYHVTVNGTKIFRNDTSNFPYAAYHLYCAPGNAKYLEMPVNICDNYSNPQPQELVQFLPHPEWALHGYPSKAGKGWIGDPRTWELDVGALSARLYFYQDPGTKPARRIWTSLDVGTEIYVSKTDEVAEWTLSDFDVIVPKH